ncbi:MAG TPA: hypothetical protein VF824_10060 [Thermoanaerobaculia bacterium]|jgi:hypothetical protein
MKKGIFRCALATAALVLICTSSAFGAEPREPIGPKAVRDEISRVYKLVVRLFAPKPTDDLPSPPKP